MEIKYKIGDVYAPANADIRDILAKSFIMSVFEIKEDGVVFTYGTNKTQSIPFEFCDVAFRKLTDAERILFTNGKDL